MNSAPYTQAKGKPCLVLDVHKEPPGSIRKKKLAEVPYKTTQEVRKPHKLL
jgi:hypothetical protein